MFFNDGANVDAKDDRGLTALHHASFNGHNKVVQALLMEHANPDANDAVFGTPLCLAAVRDNFEIVRILLESGANVRAPAGLLGSPLHCAAACSSVRVFRLLLDQDSGSLSYKAITCIQLWHAIADAGRQWLSSVSLPLQDSIQFERSSPTATAVLHNAFELTQLCLQEGADVNETLDTWKQNMNLPCSMKNASNGEIFWNMTLAMMCCLKVQPKLLGLLLEAGASPHLLDGRGDTALLFLGPGSKDDALAQACLSKLIAAGVDVNARDREGRTVLHYFARFGTKSKFETVLNADASIVIVDEDGCNVLAQAVKGNQPDMIRFLCTKGVKIDEADQSGDTALILACRKGFQDCIRPLADAGASHDICNNAGQSALVLADQEGHTDCAKLLRQLFPEHSGSHEEDQNPEVTRARNEHAVTSH